MKLGKKHNAEKGTLMAYACRCNCFYGCSSCNCVGTTPYQNGSNSLDLGNWVKANNTAMMNSTLLSMW